MLINDSTIDPKRQNLNRLTNTTMLLAPQLSEKFANGDFVGDLMTIDMVGLEKAYLIGQLGIWILRGASVDDIERHASSGDDSLPFEGAEQSMYNALLDTLAERAGERAQAAQMTIELARFMDEVLTTVQDKSQLTRADIFALFDFLGHKPTEETRSAA